MISVFHHTLTSFAKVRGWCQTTEHVVVLPEEQPFFMTALMNKLFNISQPKAPPTPWIIDLVSSNLSQSGEIGRDDCLLQLNSSQYISVLCKVIASKVVHA